LVRLKKGGGRLQETRGGATREKKRKNLKTSKALGKKQIGRSENKKQR